MAYFRCTEIGNATPSPKTPCLVSSGSQIITFPTIDGNHPYIIDTKLRWQSNSPEVNEVFLMGNGLDTAYGGGWCLRVTAGASGASWINVGDAQGNKGGKDPYYDYWYDVLCGPKRSKFYDLDKTYSTMSGGVKDLPMSLFGVSQFPNKLASIALARTKVTLEEVLIMDLIPINEFYTNYKLIDNALLSTSSGWNTYPTNLVISDAPQILTHVRIELKYQDHNNLWHSTSYIMPRADITGNGPIIPFTDGGPISEIFLKVDNRAYIFVSVTGATKDEFPIYADIRVCRNSKEGGFYDTVNNKYYFSETSTPLVYSEL